MTVRIDLLRPDDLLNLHIEAENLRLERDERGDPALVLDEPSRPGYLIVTFPPQTVVEEAVFEPSPSEPKLPMRSRIGHSSRLVFRVPPGSPLAIPFTTAGLLDWSRLELAVSALADVPPSPSAAQRRADRRPEHGQGGFVSTPGSRRSTSFRWRGPAGEPRAVVQG